MRSMAIPSFAACGGLAATSALRAVRATSLRWVVAAATAASFASISVLQAGVGEAGDEEATQDEVAVDGDGAGQCSYLGNNGRFLLVWNSTRSMLDVYWDKTGG